MSLSLSRGARSPRGSLSLAALALLPFMLSCGMSRPDVSAARTPGILGEPGAQVAAGSPLPRKPPPQGMAELPSEGGGRVLTSRMDGTPSARKMLTALRVGVEGYFDAPPVITAAFADAADENLQAAFTARLGGVPVRGVMAIQMRGEGGLATLVFDRRDAFPQTFARLSQAGAEPGGGRGAPAPVQLTPQQLPDGSGQISLPPGWRILSSYKGAVDAAGPNGELMSLGIPMAVNDPRVARLYPTVPSADFSDPVRALRDVAAFRRQPLTIVDSRPVQMQAAGRWAFIRFRAQMNGQSYDGLGLYGIQPIDEIQGILYSSSVAAPSPNFREALPGMWAAWQTWGVSDAVLRERLTSAVSSMRETGEMLTGSYWDRQDSNARMNQAWSNYVRDEGIWRDPFDPNTHYRLPNASLPPDGNTGRLEPVPTQELRP